MIAPAICAVVGCVNIRPCPVHPARFSRSRGWAWSTRIVPAILNRDGHRCVMCGRPCPHPRHHHVDHRVPRAQGGTDDPGNLRTVCEAYNLRGRCDQ